MDKHNITQGPLAVRAELIEVINRTALPEYIISLDSLKTTTNHQPTGKNRPQ
jgi:hypothetical protein